MWIKEGNILINLDHVQAIRCHKKSDGHYDLIFEYTGADEEQWINFDSKEEMLQAFEVIVHALGDAEVCDLNGK